ncbi:MAG: hypothetical protein GY809_32170, partial [Planctomycetes bacterium]|nr:hypothetical protein [Planctomycetota bacterium]
MESRQSHGRPFVFAFFVGMCVTAVLLVGCQAARPEGNGLRKGKGQAVSKEELRTAINDLTELYITKIRQASQELDELIPTTKNRKLTLQWRLRSTQALLVLSAQEDALAALVDTWVFCVRMSDYVDTGKGSEAFGVHQELARRAMADVELEAERIARLFLDDAKYEQS